MISQSSLAAGLIDDRQTCSLFGWALTCHPVSGDNYMINGRLWGIQWSGRLNALDSVKTLRSLSGTEQVLKRN